MSQVAAVPRCKERSASSGSHQKGWTWLQVLHTVLIVVHLTCMILSWEITLPEYGCMAATAA